MRILVAVACLPLAGCAFGITLGPRDVSRVPTVAALPATCPDGDAPRVTPDPTCAGGVCGFSCIPGRWAPPVAVR